MKAWKILGEALAPDGERLQLVQRDQEFVIKVNGQLLMSSRTHGSEEAMAAAGLPPALTAGPSRVLIGGLGCGFTVRAALEQLGPKAKVTVAEISQAVIDWNRGPLGPLAGHPLDDPRVRVVRTDVRTLFGQPGAFHAILLDVDNGPEALTTRGNRALYQRAALSHAHAALVPNGTLVVWSAAPDDPFANRLRAAGFTVEVRQVPIRSTKVGGRPGGRHTLFVATRG